ncbi:Apolipoprotein d [Daphnia magna]|uniref:Apolipoprotein d n=1 Tax=Daphnia magna TaxID=35525 RepID=A0A0P6CUI3_9CRUS|nr:Apolipoprotein d [Daphnia magna]
MKSLVEFATLLVLLWIAGPTTGQILRIGHCPSFSVLKDFEMDKYLGTWYQIERYFSFPGMSGKCWTQTYYPDPEVEGRYKLRMDYRDFVVENKMTAEMDIYQDMADDPATLTSQLFSMPFTADDYQVLSTDYTNYAIEYRCEDRGLFQRRESLWLLSRSPFPKSWVMKEARSVVASLGLKMSSLRPVTQDCYLPHRGLHPVRPHPQHTTNRNNFIQMYSRAPPLQQHHKLIELPRQPHFAYPALSGPERSSL